MFRFHDKNVFDNYLAHFLCLFQQRVSSFFELLYCIRNESFKLKSAQTETPTDPHCDEQGSERNVLLHSSSNVREEKSEDLSGNQSTLQRRTAFTKLQTKLGRLPLAIWQRSHWLSQEVSQLVCCANFHHLQLSLAHFVLSTIGNE